MGNESEAYILNFVNYSGTAGDSLSRQKGMKFSTKDVDNDISSGTICAQQYPGAWWFQSCFNSNLNGEYLGGHHNQVNKGMIWATFKGWSYSYKVTEMKVGRDQN